MFYLAYISTATQPFTLEELKSLLKISRDNNALQSISGILLFKQGRFMQILEGEENLVRARYDKIRGDHRHTNVSTLIEGDTEYRQFPSWSMAFYDMDGENIPGHNSFLNDGVDEEKLLHCLICCRRLLESFKRSSFLED